MRCYGLQQLGGAMKILKTANHRRYDGPAPQGSIKNPEGLIDVFCAVTQQAIQDAHDCNGYGDGVDALRYLNDETVQDWHEVIGINIRRKWNFKEVKKVRVARWV